MLNLKEEIRPVIKPTIKQDQAWKKLLDRITLFIVFGGGAGGGKSWLACEWLLTNCYFYPGTRWFLGRKQLKRLMKSSYVTFKKVCKFHKIPKNEWHLNSQLHYIEFWNGSVIDLIDLALQPSDPDYEDLGSTEYTGGVIEEGGEVDFGSFDTLKTRVGRHLNDLYKLTPKILITCNPNKKWLYRIVYKPWSKKELPPEYAFIQSLFRDNPHTASTYEKQLSQIADIRKRQRLKDGIWEYEADDNALIVYDSLLDLFTNSLDPSTERYLVCDAARYGRDLAVITLWRGFDCYRMITHEKSGTDELEEEILKIAGVEKIPRSHILVDEDGVGGGIVDHIKGCKGFVAGSAPGINRETKIKENYKNLKAQCAYSLAKKINDHEMAISADISEKDKEELIADLEQVKSKDVERDAPLQIVPKEEVKKILMRSPDRGDTFVMRMFFEVHKKPEVRIRTV